MSYVSVELSGSGRASIPEDHADDEARLQAHEWLLQLAWPHYNRALRAERAGQIPKALTAARAAARYGAHSPRVLKSMFLITAKHGYFEEAQKILGQLRDLDLDEDETFTALLERRMERWNAALEDTETLRERYGQEGAVPSYRELLLLADRLENAPTETEKAYLSDYGLAPAGAVTERDKPPEPAEAEFSERAESRSVVGWMLLAGVVGALVGGGSFYVGQFGDAEPPSEPQTTAAQPTSMPDSLVSEDRYEAVVRAGRLLAEGNPAQAYRKLDRIDDENGGRPRIDSLRASTYEALYRAGVRAWETERYEQVVKMLEPIRSTPVGSAQQRLYYLGVSAAQVGRSELAVGVLSDLMPKIDEQHPHYEAQAAYLLAELGPPDLARRNAELIAERYENTIYYNSVVRDRLGN